MAGALGQERGIPKVAPASLENPVARTQASIAAGAALFERACASCHGLDAKGGEFPTENPNAGPEPPDLTDAQWDYGSADGNIFWNIKYGIYPYMDKWGDQFRDEEIWNIVNFVRSLDASPADQK